MEKNLKSAQDMRSSSKEFIPLCGEELRKKLRERYQELGIEIKSIKNVSRKNNPISVYKIKLKQKTKTQDFINSTSRIRNSFKRSFALFRVQKTAQGLLLAISETPVPPISLTSIYKNRNYYRAAEGLKIPVVIGGDLQGGVAISDLIDFIHILIGGRPGSGKSTFLQGLVTSILISQSPDKVHPILFDTGSNDLEVFDGACPVIRDNDTAADVIFALQEELDRRSEIPAEYPYIICIADEATELLLNYESKQKRDRVCNAVSDILRRGRKAHIIWILATQNPTKEDLPVALAAIPTRVAFQCAKYHHSITILGKQGAENLDGNGDLLIKSPNCPDLIRLQGVFPEPEFIAKIVEDLAQIDCDYPNKFRISQPNFTLNEEELENENSSSQVQEKISEWDKKLCSIILWTIGKDKVSVCAIMKVFHMGEDNASSFINGMEELEIVSELFARQPRRVLCKNPEDLSEKAKDFLTRNGISRPQIEEAFGRNFISMEEDDQDDK